MVNNNDRSASAQMKKNNRAEEWLKNAVKDKHVRQIPFSEITKVKYNVAKGGSGTIHLGAWRNMHVAIKEQHNTNDLIKELKMHKQVHDSNYIVKFFGITKHPLTHDTCIVMQFAENGCLQDYLETQNISITWLTKYRLAWEIASGLDFIHRENIFHTDLHSRNILIDTGGKALITDFGLSKSVNKTIYTTKAGLFGVVPYVAPERMQNPTITYSAKCDIYSLGVILWELSSCAIPFESQLQDVMLAVNIIAGVREKTVPGTSVEYEMLYRRCWDGLPQNRPQMDIVLSELVELLAAEQISPRPAAPRPRSPRPLRPLSSDSLIAPSTYTYETDSPENSIQVGSSMPTLLRPASVRQSFGQGMAPLVHHQDIPSVPIRQDRTGVRVSFLGEPVAKDNSTDPGHPNNNTNTNNGNKGQKAANSQADATVTHENSTPNSTDARQGNDAQKTTTTPDAKRGPSPTPLTASITPKPAPEAEKSGLQFLPPIPTFTALALTSSSSEPSLPVMATPTVPAPTPVPPVPEAAMNKLPETAALALANGISMASVVSKLKMGSLRTISTISPPPPGAPPPPPNAVAGHSNSPRVISPPTGNRPGVTSPPKGRNPRPSKTISPPSRMGVPMPPPGAPPRPSPSPSPTASPSPSPSLGPIPKPAPPQGPPPSSPRNPATPINKSPEIAPAKSLTTAGTGAEASVSLSDTNRPTPARQIPMGFPVVTPLSPPHWGKRTTFLPGESNSTLTPSVSSASSSSPATQSPASSSPSSAQSSPASSPTSSPSSSPPSGNETTPAGALSEAGGVNSRRDFRPISFLTEQKHPVVVDLASITGDANNYTKSSDNAYVPNPNNNIVPPNQLHLRPNSPEFARKDGRYSRLMDGTRSPSPSPSLGPRPFSPAFGPGFPSANGRGAQDTISSAAIAINRGGGGQGFFPVVEASWSRNNAPVRRISEDDQYKVEAISHPDSASRPQLQPSKESSSSTATTNSTTTTTTATTTATSISTSPSPIAAVSKPRVKLDNFYSLSDPYKDLNVDEPTDFFNAVSQSDHPTIERMLKLFPQLIHESNGFWPHPTPILLAARSQRPLETIKLLHSYGAAVDRGDHNGTTVLHYICDQYSEPLEGIQFLCKAGADTNSRDAKKRTPLMILLQNTPNAVDTAQQSQRTPLHYAITYCKEPAPVMELLLKKSADVNARDWRKLTPLHMILERMDNEEIVQMLLLYGADPSLKNGNKRNALMVAAENLRVMSAWFLLENDLQSSAPESIKRAMELCSKADGPDKNSKPLFKNMLSDWAGKDGRVRRIQLAQDCIMRVQRTPDMKTVDQTMHALEFLESVGVPIQVNNGSSTSVNSQANMGRPGGTDQAGAFLAEAFRKPDKSVLGIAGMVIGL
ncbi:hypothetical protein BGZ93_005588 [Podila epicladia]|nr:hypothetical protein BGZ93_005588 [Podila epicladia]